MQNCPSLQTLRINNASFNKDNEDVLHMIPLHLKGLHLVNCSGVDEIWTLRFTDLIELTVSSFSETFNHDMFKYCKQLSYLDVQRCDSLKAPAQFEQIFQSNNQIKTLKLNYFGEDTSNYVLNCGIAEKLPNFESLAILDNLPRSWFYFRPHQLKHVKILDLKCPMHDFVDPLLRILSECGAIEELTIRDCNLQDDEYDLPLKFEKLTKLHWTSTSRGVSVKFFTIFTQARTPELRDLYYISNQVNYKTLSSY